MDSTVGRRRQKLARKGYPSGLETGTGRVEEATSRGKLKTIPYDTANYLRTPKERARFLEFMIEETNGDPYWVMNALNTIARSEGMTKVARKTNLSRESLYKSLSGKRNPGFATIVKVMAALGLQFQVVAR